MIADQKQSLRSEARAVLAGLPGLRGRTTGMAVLGHLAMWIDWHRAKTVAAYCALPTEPHVLTPWPEAKTVLLPRIEGDRLELHGVGGPEELVEGPFGPRIMKDSGNPSSACQDSQAGRPFICRAGEAELVQIAVQRPDLRAKADAKQQHIRRHIARQFWQRATR